MVTLVRHPLPSTMCMHQKAVSTILFVNTDFDATIPGRGMGIQQLHNSSLPQAIQRSPSHDPPKCFPGTREVYIQNIVDWASGGWVSLQARVLWMWGAAGVGKSAVAQASAERLKDLGQLGASFFFFRPNEWNDPDKVFLTIAYQLATRFSNYRKLLDAIILQDHLVLEKSMYDQFWELLVKPLGELSARGQGVDTNAVIVIDGLDECRSMASQTKIIELVVTSIHQQTTPFMWAIFSRREPHIASAFSSELAAAVSLQLTLPISRDVNSDIELYLRDSFAMIRAKHSLPPTTIWPSENDILRLIELSSGTFVYAATSVRFIDLDTGASGPKERLRSMLEVGGPNHSAVSALDHLYMLILGQIPKAHLPITLSLLCLHLSAAGSSSVLNYCSILGLSLTAFDAATNNLHSVLYVKKSISGMPHQIFFYHTSFADFLCDASRSKVFCVEGPDIHQRCLTAIVSTLHHILNTSGGKYTYPRH